MEKISSSYNSYIIKQFRSSLSLLLLNFSELKLDFSSEYENIKEIKDCKNFIIETVINLRKTYSYTDTKEEKFINDLKVFKNDLIKSYIKLHLYLYNIEKLYNFLKPDCGEILGLNSLINDNNKNEFENIITKDYFIEIQNEIENINWEDKNEEDNINTLVEKILDIKELLNKFFESTNYIIILQLFLENIEDLFKIDFILKDFYLFITIDLEKEAEIDLFSEKMLTDLTVYAEESIDEIIQARNANKEFDLTSLDSEAANIVYISNEIEDLFYENIENSIYNLLM